MKRIQVIDSHTEGEPTRVVIGGGPDLGTGSARDRMKTLARDFDWLRRSINAEPRGFDFAVSAVLCEPQSSDAIAQVLFFNNSGYLGMCVHGTLGVAATLRHLGRISAGRYKLETTVGDVHINVADDNSLSVENVESYRSAAGVAVTTAQHGTVHGDIAWGGNWFFLVGDHSLTVSAAHLATLTDFASDVRHSLARQGITGDDGGEIDHVELFGPPQRPDADSKNFVLCPGLAYDRSPCGTGTSAKLACLSADGRLREGQTWRQESIIGSLFEGTIRKGKRGVIPTIAGNAWITAETTLLLDPTDPFRYGIS